MRRMRFGTSALFVLATSILPFACGGAPKPLAPPPPPYGNGTIVVGGGVPVVAPMPTVQAPVEPPIEELVVSAPPMCPAVSAGSLRPLSNLRLERKLGSATMSHVARVCDLLLASGADRVSTYAPSSSTQLATMHTRKHDPLHRAFSIGRAVLDVEDGYLVARDATTAAVDWKRKWTSASFELSCATETDGVVMAIDSYLTEAIARDVTNGEKLWSSADIRSCDGVAKNRFLSLEVVDDDATGELRNLRVYDARKGDRVWSIEGLDTKRTVASGGGYVVVGSDGALTVYDAADGKKQREISLGKGRFAEAIRVVDGIAYVVSLHPLIGKRALLAGPPTWLPETTFEAFDLSNGKTKFRTKLVALDGKAPDFEAAPRLAIGSDAAYVVTADGLARAFDRTTGALAWTWSVGSGVTNVFVTDRTAQSDGALVIARVDDALGTSDVLVFERAASPSKTEKAVVDGVLEVEGVGTAGVLLAVGDTTVKTGEGGKFHAVVNARGRISVGWNVLSTACDTPVSIELDGRSTPYTVTVAKLDSTCE